MLYPPLCIHCRTMISPGNVYLCDRCFDQLSLIDHRERCPRCFGSDYCAKLRVCSSCPHVLFPFDATAAAFDYLGPAASLVRKLKYSNQPYLAKGAAAFMAVQLLQLPWPLPEVIVPMPIALTHRWQRGYNQSALLAEELSHIFDLPICSALKRYSGDYSQVRLDREQRKTLTAETFALNRGAMAALGDRVVLLVDDVMTTASTLRCAAEKLAESCPAKIYSFTFCRSTI